MRTIYRALQILSAAAFIGSIAWLIHSPDYEPAIACMTSLATFLGSFIADRQQKNKSGLHQSVSKGSVGIQAGGDISMGNFNNSRSKK